MRPAGLTLIVRTAVGAVTAVAVELLVAAMLEVVAALLEVVAAVLEVVAAMLEVVAAMLEVVAALLAEAALIAEADDELAAACSTAGRAAV